MIHHVFESVHSEQHRNVSVVLSWKFFKYFLFQYIPQVVMMDVTLGDRQDQVLAFQLVREDGVQEVTCMERLRKKHKQNTRFLLLNTIILIVLEWRESLMWISLSLRISLEP